MEKIRLGKSGLMVPPIAVGCMRITGMTASETEAFFRTAIEEGANFIDHADIYGAGRCEEIFGDLMRTAMIPRERVLIQSKCGIKNQEFDFSKKHILASVEGSLKRLKTDYIDVLLLHRPDALVEPEEVAEAFDLLHKAGKVRHFGVSNHKPMQIRLLQKYLRQPLVANQIQMSITNATAVTQGLSVNTMMENGVDRDGSVLDFCRLEDITVQPWSPFQHGYFSGPFLGNEKYPELNRLIDELAEKYRVANTTIAIAWLLRHPAKLQPVTGTTNVQRLRDCIRAAEIKLERSEWYRLLLAAGNTLP